MNDITIESKLEEMTIREAIEIFPKLLDEKVYWGLKQTNIPVRESEYVTFQFFGDGNYRTNKIFNKNSNH